MSFLLRTSPLLRTALGQQSTRCFSTTLTQHNVIKDTAKQVDRTVSDQLVKGIDKGSMSTLAHLSCLSIPYSKADPRHVSLY